jgi:nitroreductase
MNGLKISKECLETFDNVLEARRSIRFFKNEMPPKELVEDIITAGL